MVCSRFSTLLVKASFSVTDPDLELGGGGGEGLRGEEAALFSSACRQDGILLPAFVPSTIFLFHQIKEGAPSASATAFN